MDDDNISRAAALDALGERPIIWSDNDDYTLGERNQYDMDRLAIETVPSAQLAQDLTKGCTDTISRAAVVDAIEGVDWYHQNKNGEMVHGANSAEHQAWYKAEDIYAAIEALPSAQPDKWDDTVYRKAVEMLLAHFVPEERYAEAVDGLRRLPSAQPGWIPVTERLPENGYWLWSAKGGEVQKDFYWNGHWENAEKYGYEVIAWMPLPTPYREGGQS